jgi:3-isopropylmalate dehydratase small subunit
VVKEGDEIQIDLGAGEIHHAGARYNFPKVPDSLRQLLEAGGLEQYLKALQAGSTAD